MTASMFQEAASAREGGPMLLPEHDGREYRHVSLENQMQVSEHMSRTSANTQLAMLLSALGVDRSERVRVCNVPKRVPCVTLLVLLSFLALNLGSLAVLDVDQARLQFLRFGSTHELRSYSHGRIGLG